MGVGMGMGGGTARKDVHVTKCTIMGLAVTVNVSVVMGRPGQAAVVISLGTSRRQSAAAATTTVPIRGGGGGGGCYAVGHPGCERQFASAGH
jgi:hypothetical protein